MPALQAGPPPVATELWSALPGQGKFMGTVLVAGSWGLSLWWLVRGTVLVVARCLCSFLLTLRPGAGLPLQFVGCTPHGPEHKGNWEPEGLGKEKVAAVALHLFGKCLWGTFECWAVSGSPDITGTRVRPPAGGMSGKSF